jgi:hypothetical protein
MDDIFSEIVRIREACSELCLELLIFACLVLKVALATPGGCDCNLSRDAVDRVLSL